MYDFPCDKPVSATMKVSAGTCEVLAEERDTVTVEVLPHDPNNEASQQAAKNTTVQLTGNHLTVQTPESGGIGWLFGRRSGRLRITVRLPLDSTVHFKTGSADLTCTGRLAKLAVDTASGDVYADQVAGDVKVNSASGDVRLGQVDGSVAANSASGDLAVEYVGGDVSGNSASGSVALGTTEGNVKMTTASGDMQIRTARRGSITSHSASGDVSVGVPAGTGVWLDLNTFSGTTTSDLTVGAQTPPNGHDLEIRVNTMSGDIAINRV